MEGVSFYGTVSHPTCCFQRYTFDFRLSVSISALLPCLAGHPSVSSLGVRCCCMAGRFEPSVEHTIGPRNHSPAPPSCVRRGSLRFVPPTSWLLRGTLPVRLCRSFFHLPIFLHFFPARSLSLTLFTFWISFSFLVGRGAFSTLIRPRSGATPWCCVFAGGLPSPVPLHVPWLSCDIHQEGQPQPAPPSSTPQGGATDPGSPLGCEPRPRPTSRSLCVAKPCTNRASSHTSGFGDGHCLLHSVGPQPGRPWPWRRTHVDTTWSQRR